MERLEFKTFIPGSQKAVWDFFSDPRNLSAITPDWLNFKIVDEGGLPKEIYPGLIIFYQVKPLPGFKNEWVTEITHVEKEKLFVDHQRSGPYKFWHHQHLFHKDEGGVLVEDIIHYRLPLGAFGKAVFGPIVRRRLKKIFDYRTKKLGELFPGAKVVSHAK